MAAGGVTGFEVAFAAWLGEIVTRGMSPKGRLAIRGGLDESLLHGHPYLGSEHLMLGALRADPELSGSFRELADIEHLLEDAMRFSSTKVEAVTDQQRKRAAIWRKTREPALLQRLSAEFEPKGRPLPIITPRAERHLRAAAGAAQRGGTAWGPDHLVIAILADPGGISSQALAHQGVSRAAIESWIRARRDWGALLALINESRDSD